MYYVYFLQSTLTGRYYIGFTNDLTARLNYHNRGKVKSTKTGVPWEIVYYEAHRTSTLARSAERFYKTGQGRRQIKRKLGL